MSLKTALYTIDRDHLPVNATDLGARFVRQKIATIKADSPPKDMVLMVPASNLLTGENAVGPEPRFNTILCGLRLQTQDGNVAEGTGQVVITAQRLLGMVDYGTLTGGLPLSVEANRHVYCFTFHRDDVYPPNIKKHRLIPSEFSFRSKEEVEVSFLIMIFSAAAYVANGKMGYWHDKHMLNAFSHEGRQRLLA